MPNSALLEKRKRALDAVSRATQERIGKFPLIMGDLEEEERRLREDVNRTQRLMEENLRQKDGDIEETRKALKEAQTELNDKRNARLDLDIALGEIVKKIRQSGHMGINLITGFTTEEICDGVDEWCDVFEEEINKRQEAHTQVVSGMREAVTTEVSNTILLEYERKQLQDIQARNFKELDLDRSVLFPVIKPQPRIVSRYDLTTAYPPKVAPHKKKLPPIKNREDRIVACYHGNSLQP
jgi:hypothetical protein